MKPAKEKIKEIAELLDMGMTCVFSPKTGKILSFLDDELLEESLLEKELEEMNYDPEECFEFEAMSSKIFFDVMSDFSQTVNDEALKDKLSAALNKPHPFCNFKQVINNAGEFRNKWFEYKDKCYIRWVEEQVELNKDAFDV